MRQILALMDLKIRLVFANIPVCMTLLMPVGLTLIARMISGSDFSEADGLFSLGMSLSLSIVMGAVLLGSSMLAEEKEKHTLRVLMTSGISGKQYIIGSLVPYTLIVEGINLVLLPICNVRLSLRNFVYFIGITLVTTAITMLLGFTIGIISKNTTEASAYVTPLFLILGMYPIFGSLNEFIKMFTDWVYMGILVDYVKDIYDYHLGFRDIFVLLVWFGLDIWVFIKAYQKNGLDE